jgi:DNA-binding NarL/FixJ family response regulator
VDLISEEADIELVGVARNGAEAIAIARTAEIDVVLFDLEATTAGAELASVIHHLSHHEPRIRLIALSSYDDDASVRRILGAGFHRHVSKISGDEELVKIVLEEHV